MPSPIRRLVAPALIALILLAAWPLLAARHTPTPTGPPPEVTSTTLRPPAYVPVPAGFPTTTAR